MILKEGSGSLERRIVTAMIVSKEFLTRISPVLELDHLGAQSARIIASWCQDYYKEYQTAPGKHITDIYSRKSRDGFDPDTGDEIKVILQSLSDDYDSEDFNLDYLVDETNQYCAQQSILTLGELLQEHAEEGKLTEAQELLANFSSKGGGGRDTIIWKDREASLLRDAFLQAEQPLIKFPGDLGRFINPELTRESFVGIMGPEKSGKTFFLLELAVRALRSGSNVAFFEAGDMSRRQLILRLCTYIARRNYRKKFCGEMYIPVVDCIHNQMDTCTREDRAGDFGPFEDKEQNTISNLPAGQLIKAFDENPSYEPCRHCQKAGKPYFRGTLWYRHRDAVPPLSWKEAYKELQTFDKTVKRNMAIMTYPNDTLKMSDIEAELCILEQEQGWTPDVTIIDYADLMVGEGSEERDKQNKLWKRLRALSQKRRGLVITATQTDARSYDQKTLNRSNFSEDKRKYAHVTCMLGLQQTRKEKKKGVLRVNKLVVREDSFDETKCVNVLQKLEIGRPFLGSF